jgi:hypothetical protein
MDTVNFLIYIVLIRDYVDRYLVDSVKYAIHVLNIKFLIIIFEN